MEDAQGAPSPVVRLAPLLAEHLEVVCSINARVQSHPWKMKHWQSCMLPSYCNWVLLAPEPIAYISFLVTGDTAELMNIGVAPEYQSRGVGRQLLATGILLLPAPVHTLYLEVRQSNRVARKLYESMGFRTLSRRENYYPLDDESREPALVYRLENEGEALKNIDFYHGCGKLEGLIMRFPEGRGMQDD